MFAKGVENGMDVRVRWLQFGRPPSTTMLELLISAAVVGAMICVAAHSWQHARPRLDLLDAASVMTGPRVAIMEFHAVTGTWPASNRRAGYFAGEFMQGGRLKGAEIRDGGAVDITLSDRVAAHAGKVVTFRGWQGSDAGDAPVAWLCGHAGAALLHPASADRTTLTEDELPSSCRARK